MCGRTNRKKITSDVFYNDHPISDREKTLAFRHGLIREYH